MKAAATATLDCIAIKRASPKKKMQNLCLDGEHVSAVFFNKVTFSKLAEFSATK